MFCELICFPHGAVYEETYMCEIRFLRVLCKYQICGELNGLLLTSRVPHNGGCERTHLRDFRILQLDQEDQVFGWLNGLFLVESQQSRSLIWINKGVDCKDWR